MSNIEQTRNQSSNTKESMSRKDIAIVGGLALVAAGIFVYASKGPDYSQQERDLVADIQSGEAGKQYPEGTSIAVDASRVRNEPWRGTEEDPVNNQSGDDLPNNNGTVVFENPIYIPSNESMDTSTGWLGAPDENGEWFWVSSNVEDANTGKPAPEAVAADQQLDLSIAQIRAGE